MGSASSTNSDQLQIGHDYLQILGGLFLLGIVFRLVLLIQEPTVIQNYQTDDSYYYYSIARNIVQGNGIVLNQGIATNGFHPLHLVVLIPIFAVFYPLGVNAPIYATLTLLLVLNVATAGFLFLIARELYDEHAGLLASAIWLLNPHIAKIYLSGMEIGLQIFFLSILTYYLVSHEKWSQFSTKQAAVVGILLGLTFLSRMDAAFVAIGFAMAFLIRYLRQSSGAVEFSLDRVQPLVTVTLTAFIVALPWFLYSLVVVGRLTPVSGEGIRFETLQLGTSSTTTLLYEATFWFASSYVQILIDIPLELLSRPLYILVAGVGGVFFGYTVATHRKFTRNIINSLDFLLIGAALYYPFYIFYQMRVRWYYTLFTSFLITLLFALAVAKVLESMEKQRLKRAASAGIVLLIAISLVTSGLQLHGQQEGYMSVKNDVSEYMMENLPANTTIAAIGGGGYQYFDREHDILILAWVINPESLEARQQGRIESYLVENDVEYIINHRTGIDNLREEMENHELVVVRTWNGPGDFEPTLVRIEETPNPSKKESDDRIRPLDKEHSTEGLDAVDFGGTAHNPDNREGISGVAFRKTSSAKLSS